MGAKIACGGPRIAAEAPRITPAVPRIAAEDSRIASGGTGPLPMAPESFLVTPGKLKMRDVSCETHTFERCPLHGEGTTGARLEHDGSTAGA